MKLREEGYLLSHLPWDRDEKKARGIQVSRGCRLSYRGGWLRGTPLRRTTFFVQVSTERERELKLDDKKGISAPLLRYAP
jgi:hypothetical protein